jgi:2,4-dienoyl-CoA reductase-like NADH-dependent reductase (Old Yellow Enzyme family)
MADLFDPIELGDIYAKNRIIMAPLTRSRAGETRVPNDLMAQYYAQRAGAGLIISEATAISPEGYGWYGAPGIYSEAHIEGWKKTTEAVHAQKGKMVLQLWHMGRVSHPDFLGGELPVAPSAIAAEGEANTPTGKKPYVTPRALSIEGIRAIVEDYARAAGQAIQAGFDGVEIHAANGYLLDQFIRDGANKRTDTYGGSSENRIRIVREVIEAIGFKIGQRKVGIRISPNISYNGMSDSDPLTTYSVLADALNRYDLAYVHVRETLPPRGVEPSLWVTSKIRAIYKGNLLVNGSYDLERAQSTVRGGDADAVVFGIPFIANPDLVERFRTHAPLNPVRQDTLYAGGPEGYVDYPTHS